MKKFKIEKLENGKFKIQKKIFLFYFDYAAEFDGVKQCINYLDSDPDNKDYKVKYHAAW